MKGFFQVPSRFHCQGFTKTNTRLDCEEIPNHSANHLFQRAGGLKGKVQIEEGKREERKGEERRGYSMY